MTRSRRAIATTAAILLLAAGAGCAARSEGASQPQLGHPTRSTGCHVHGLLPEAACTPGSVFAQATADRICVPGYARSVRNVSEATRAAVYAAYGIAPHQGSHYELDHLVSLELGGDNSQANLWPEVAPGYGRKDTVENELHAAVCSRRLPLRTAQLRIARDWLHAGVAVPPSRSSSGRRTTSPHPGTGSFCATHRCIPSFDNGHGTIVQCADGEWSHSGGLPGACSRHGGVR